jgi:hypothetical protein
MFSSGTQSKLSAECGLGRGNPQCLGILYLPSQSSYFDPIVFNVSQFITIRRYSRF